MPEFTLPDPYDGWSEDQLKQRLRKLIRDTITTERIVAMLVEYAPEALEHLPNEYREKAKNLNQAYRDGDIEGH